jgi:hypothetical protein
MPSAHVAYIYIQQGRWWRGLSLAPELMLRCCSALLGQSLLDTCQVDSGETTGFDADRMESLLTLLFFFFISFPLEIFFYHSTIVSV